MTTFLYCFTLSCILIPVYVYIGYPLILFIVTRFYRKPHIRIEDTDSKVSMIVSCYNESAAIRAKVENCLSIDYPHDRIEFIFVSDGSTDGTDEIIGEFSDSRIRLIRQEGRLGKTAGINLAVPQARGEYVVFSDANAMYQPDAIIKLVGNFSTPDIGYVVGAALYSDGTAGAAAESENSYWKYELFIKDMESKIHSVVGGDGAIYAIRRDLYETLDATDINDFVNPLQIVARGYRGVFEPKAICFEETAGNFRSEARRKERIVNRSFKGLIKVRQVLNPFRSGIFAFEVISHKLLRWFIPVFVLGIAVGSTLLSYQQFIIFQYLYLLGTLFLWLAIVGFYQQNRSTISPVFFYPYYFLLVNYYSLIGIFRALMGDIQVTWNTHRSDQQSDRIDKRSRIFTVVLIVIPVLVFLDFSRIL